uniref:IncF plasmid conjugative transfer pilus assembly protein TraB n=1 Tax=Klebsiella pneumoniae TaxID=573 RepID=A0A8B0STG1_KLEPN|nr:IncF plasmid conjugative transfer pilus assembly protein TraB [Klebsiella pneumoniae]
MLATQKRAEDQYLPATSQLYAVLVTGVEAPTSLSSQEEPLGVTFRVKRDVFFYPITTEWIYVTATS